jgi:Domain of unknown function (DUF1905)
VFGIQAPFDRLRATVLTMTETFHHTAPLWIWTTDKAPASWHFITIDGEVGDAIKATSIMRRLEGNRARGFGSMKVTATIGGTSWVTSIFPAKDVGGWLLPVKAAVRKMEGIVAGDMVMVGLEI